MSRPVNALVIQMVSVQFDHANGAAINIDVVGADEVMDEKKGKSKMRPIKRET